MEVRQQELVCVDDEGEEVLKIKGLESVKNSKVLKTRVVWNYYLLIWTLILLYIGLLYHGFIYM